MTPPARDPGELLTIAQIAAEHDVPEKTVYTWKRAGKLPTPDQQSGRFMFWRRSTIEGWTPPARGHGRPRA